MPNKKSRAKTALMAFGVMPLLTTVVSGCGADDGQAQTPAADQVEVLEVNVENDQYAAPDLDRAGMSVGDMDVFSGNALRDGRKVGHGGGSCQAIHVDGERVTSQCLLTMELEHGSVTMQALWVRGSSPLDMAITGGTDAYRDARGAVRFWDIGTPNERVRAEIIR
ncbi:allene oxide cyclase barrel-like domain-containing protein [Nocardia gipuzkoensis]